MPDLPEEPEASYDVYGPPPLYSPKLSLLLGCLSSVGSPLLFALILFLCGNSLSLFALVLLAAFLLSVFSIVSGVAAIVTGKRGFAHGMHRGEAVWGMITGAVGIFLAANVLYGLIEFLRRPPCSSERPCGLIDF